MKKLLEVCVDSLASARAAQAGGADRLEFCSALAVGGLSPYPELLRQIKAECSLPVRCLMRPRAGDFLYTKDEIDLLCAQIHTLRDTGADGFVIGALTPDGVLDKPAMAQLLDACGDKPVTLHRCIDVSCDLVETYRDAATLGIDTVLTSGGAASCRQGTAALAKMLALRNELQGRRRQRRRHHRAARCPARGTGFPSKRQKTGGKRHALPPRGRPHGPARAGRVAHPADGHRRCARCQSRAAAIKAYTKKSRTAAALCCFALSTQWNVSNSSSSSSASSNSGKFS